MFCFLIPGIFHDYTGEHARDRIRLEIEMFLMFWKEESLVLKPSFISIYKISFHVAVWWRFSILFFFVGQNVDSQEAPHGFQ